MLNRVLQIIHQRIASGKPDSSYVASIVQKGEDKILRKIGEEATEVVLAAKGQDRVALVHELTDLWFHCLVLMAEKEISLRILTMNSRVVSANQELRKRLATNPDLFLLFHQN